MAEPQPIFFKDSARRVQCKMKVNKLQFICLIGGARPHLGATRPRVGIC